MPALPASAGPEPPVAVDDAYTTDEDTALVVDADTGVLANDSDPDDDHATLVASLVTDVENGVLALEADGSFTYTPAPDYNGEDTFTYEVSDGTTAVGATVTITIEPVDDPVNGPPVAVEDAYQLAPGETQLVVEDPLEGVLANDTDPDDDELIVSAPAPDIPFGTDLGGTVTVNADGTFTYTPPAEFGCADVDTFLYTASDGELADSALVEILLLLEPVPGEAKLSLSSKFVEYGTLITITGRLPAHAVAIDPVLSIFRTPVGGNRVLLAQGPVDENGKLVVDKKLYKSNFFQVEWEGDLCLLEDDSASKKVTVKARTTGALSGFYSTLGKFKLYHDAVDPTFVGKVIPNHAGLNLWLVLHKKVNGAWKLVFNQKFTLPASSAVGGQIVGLDKDLRYRIRAVFKGHADHARDESPWFFFRFTG
ncbi:MAG: tandem-95 repeat protein [Actinobacteria bacterium]|nr:tandem-95 repeat protein [Actinomycetota bacterium]